MENLKQLFNLINLNGGATLKKDLSNALKGVKRGYCVSVYGSEKVINNNLNSFIKAIRKQLINLNNNYCIGVWLNKENNKIYVDYSIIIKSKRQALYVAKLFNQIAIYSIKKNKSIYLK